jgi:small acid-soluble spore protein (thioredoxin-like protein)
MAKPDDRSDNRDRIEHNIGHTLQNLDEAEDYLNAHDDEMSEQEVRQIRAKNKRRMQSVEGLRKEIKDEAAFSKK